MQLWITVTNYLFNYIVIYNYNYIFVNFLFGRNETRLVEGKEIKFELKNCMLNDVLYSHHFNWKNIYYKVTGFHVYNCRSFHWGVV